MEDENPQSSVKELHKLGYISFYQTTDSLTYRVSTKSYMAPSIPVSITTADT